MKFVAIYLEFGVILYDPIAVHLITIYSSLKCCTYVKLNKAQLLMDLVLRLP
jgi:hypothetical protein